MSRDSSVALVFGGGGWVGVALRPRLAARWVVHAPGSSELDVADRAAVDRVVDRVRPRAVLNLAAVNPGSGDLCAMNAVNRDGAANVARAAARVGARLVHVSTDLVLDGRSPPYADDAPSCPVGDYGRSKAQGEAAVLDEHAAAVAVRTSLVFDSATMDRSTRGFADRLARGEPCRLFVDEIRCPISRHALAAALVELLDLDVAGLLNVAGAQPLSRHAFGLRMLRWFGVTGTGSVETAVAAELAPARPRDLTLDVSRATSILATPPRSVDEELASAARPQGDPID